MLFTNENLATKLNGLTSTALSYYFALTTVVCEYYYQIVLSNLMKKIESQSIRIMDSETIYGWSDLDSNSVYSSSDDLKSASTEFNLATHAHKIYIKAKVIF